MFKKETKEYKERISEECLETILDNHQHWLHEDCVGWENMRANLRGTNLCNADLSYTNLHNANLCGADLSRANLRGANLRGANLRDADLRGTNLYNADLGEANLRGTNLYNADLGEANLRGANLRDAGLNNANLCNADLGEANLCGADLRGARNVPYIPMICPEEGDFIGWKKAESNKTKVIVKLHIPFDAKRSSATTRKCRCSKAEVIAIYNLDGTEAGETTCHSDYDNSFIYEVGKTVEVTNFNEDRWSECAKGIHFFINRQEAIDY